MSVVAALLTASRRRSLVRDGGAAGVEPADDPREETEADHHDDRGAAPRGSTA